MTGVGRAAQTDMVLFCYATAGRVQARRPTDNMSAAVTCREEEASISPVIDCHLKQT